MPVLTPLVLLVGILARLAYPILSSEAPYSETIFFFFFFFF